MLVCVFEACSHPKRTTNVAIPANSRSFIVSIPTMFSVYARHN